MTIQLIRSTRNRTWFPFPSRARDERARLICLPFAGGGASRFLPLSRLLEPDLGVHPVQFPGREGRFDDPAHSDAGALVTELAGAVAELADRPYAVLGYSLGASYAYELVRALEKAGAPAPRALFAVASPAPHTRSALRLSDATDTELLERVKSWQAVPDEVLGDAELLGMALNTLRIDLGTWERHRHDISTRLSIPIHVYTGDTDPTVTRPQLAGWRTRTTGTARFRTFTGGHFFGFDQGEVLAAAVRADLALYT
ncbi:alpha/beta fold hydrolase [Phytomonospora sp. NPDC050363]|uniref:thioesterase II family protein n=1 Tax=Phytomonospora sp. NPDC050363 TaxID=3155642 RepID=UPI0033D8ACD6